MAEIPSLARQDRPPTARALEHSRRHRRLKGERKRIRAEARLWAAEEPAWNREDQNRFDPEGVR
jgi:hypothetical protein